MKIPINRKVNVNMEVELTSLEIAEMLLPRMIEAKLTYRQMQHIVGYKSPRSIQKLIERAK